MTDFWQRMGARATGAERSLRARRPEPFEPRVAVLAAGSTPGEVTPWSSGPDRLEADVEAVADRAAESLADNRTRELGPQRPTLPPVDAGRPDPAAAPNPGREGEGRPSSAEGDRVPLVAEPGAEPGGDRRRAAPARRVTTYDVTQDAPAPQAPRPPVAPATGDGPVPQPAPRSPSAPGPPARPAEPTPPARARDDRSAPFPLAAEHRAPTPPATARGGLPLDVAALLRKQVMAVLRARGAVGARERPVVREEGHAPAVATEPAPGTVVLQPGATTFRFSSGHHAEGSSRRQPPAVPAEPPQVQVHIDRLVVTRAPATPPKPAPPPRRATVDHEAYLARRRERR